MASASELGVNAAAQAIATTAAPGKRTNLVRLGFVDDLGFFVNDSDEDGRHDLCTSPGDSEKAGAKG